MTKCPVVIDWIEYASVENAYQAAKTYSKEERCRIAKLAPNASKKAGRNVKLRDDWESIKLAVMYVGLRQKFDQPQWKNQLQANGVEYLVEWNNWGDRIWGIPCKIDENEFAIPTGQTGHNYLGRLLMVMRDKPIDVAGISFDSTDELRELSHHLIQEMPPIFKELTTSITHYETKEMPSDRMSVAIYGSEITLVTETITQRLDNIIARGGQIHLCRYSKLTIAVEEHLRSKCYSRITYHNSSATLVRAKYGLLVKGGNLQVLDEYHPSNRTRIVTL